MSGAGESRLSGHLNNLKVHSLDDMPGIPRERYTPLLYESQAAARCCL